MAMLPSKHLRLLFVAFLFLCFIITTTTRAGRSLRERDTKEGGLSAVKPSSSLYENNDNNNNKVKNSNVFDPKQVVHELATMDYTPAGKNPPIHN